MQEDLNIKNMNLGNEKLRNEKLNNKKLGNEKMDSVKEESLNAKNSNIGNMNAEDLGPGNSVNRNSVKENSHTKFIMSIINPFRFKIAILFLINVFYALDQNLKPYLLKIMLDRLSIGKAHDIETILWPAGIYIGTSILFLIFFRIYDYIWLKLNSPMKCYIGDTLMNKLMQHSHEFFQNQFAGSVANKVKDVMSGVPDLIRIIIDQFFGNGLLLIIGIYTIWNVNYKFTIALLIWSSLFIIVSFYFGIKARALSDKASEVRSKTMGQFVDILGNIMNVRLFAGQKSEGERLSTTFIKYIKADQNRDWYFLKISAFQGMSFVAYQSVCLFWLIKGFKEGNITQGDFAFVIGVNTSIINHLWSLSKDVGSFANILGNVTQGLRVTLYPVEVLDKENSTQIKVKTGEIVFNKVLFHYKGATPLFSNLSICIKSGQKVGLVGYSGSGKTTFVNLIMRIYDLNEGSILIDNQNIAEVSQSSLRRNIGMIPQEPSLFHRSLMENIKYGRADATDKEVIEAAEKADAHEFIIGLSEGYNSLVGERGIKLSGGQRQRIAIARAILKNAPILILDEATSQLDSVTETVIQDALWELMQGKTTIVIAHRLSTLLNMDRILVFDKGKIVEDGSHIELMEKGGLYKRLWEAQIAGFLPQNKA